MVRSFSMLHISERRKGRKTTKNDAELNINAQVSINIPWMIDTSIKTELKPRIMYLEWLTTKNSGDDETFCSGVTFCLDKFIIN